MTLNVKALNAVPPFVTLQKRRSQALSPYTSQAHSMGRRLFSRTELDFYLYGRSKVLPVTLEGTTLNEEETKRREKIPNYKENSIDILQLRYKPGVDKEFRSTEEFNKVLNAIKMIPPQLHLCYSSVPGAGFGICATELIPVGTWIGPYEGRRGSIEDIGDMLDTRHVWEIYKHGLLDHIVNASDRDQSSWMKYIQCARNPTEQNTVVFQVTADIYFQTKKNIRPGEELLAWYAEYYEQYLGIPVGVRTLTKEVSQTERLNKETNEGNGKVHLPETEEYSKSKTNEGRDSIILSQASSSTYTNNVQQTTEPALHQTLSSQFCPQSTISNSQLNRTSITENTYEERPLDSTPQGKPTTQAMDTNPPSTNLKTRFWTCHHCLSIFPQKWALQVHICPCDVAQPYKCSNCNTAYSNTIHAQAHAISCATGAAYKCSYCARSFMNVNILTKHLRVHSGQSMASGTKRKTQVLNL